VLTGSVALHAAVLAAVVALSARDDVQDLYQTAIPVLFYGVPPPPPPPPPAPSVKSTPKPQRKVVVQRPQEVVKPVVKPVDEKVPEPERQPEPEPEPEPGPAEDVPSNQGGVPGGVPGGVAGGVVGGQVGGVVGGSLAPKPKPAPAPPPPPAPPPAPAPPVHLTRNMVPAKVVRRVEPVYPRMAREARLQGRVMLMLVVDARGRVVEARVLSGPAILATAAVEAVKQWLYEPSRTPDGKPLATYIPQPVEFKLR
jgi:protein TonB